MSKETFLAHLAALYAAMNMADSDNPERTDWMLQHMAGHAGCNHLDKMLKDMRNLGMLTPDEVQTFYDAQ